MDIVFCDVRSSKKMSNLKKAAVIGGGAYLGYQLGKATSK